MSNSFNAELDNIFNRLEGKSIDYVLFGQCGNTDDDLTSLLSQSVTFTLNSIFLPLYKCLCLKKDPDELTFLAINHILQMLSIPYA